MAKRKVLIETINNYHGMVHSEETDWIAYEVMLKVNGNRFQATVDVTSKDNPGGQVWDWATENWDQVVPLDGPTVKVMVEGNMVDVPTKLKWACITGVYDSSGKALEVKAIKSNTSKTRAYAKGAKEQRGYKLPPAEVIDTNKKFNKRPTPTAPEKKADVLDFETYKQEKIKQALTEEE